MKAPKAGFRRSDLTQEKLRTLLSYDRNTGGFKWVDRSRSKKADGLAGTKSTFGYWQIVIDNRSYFAHRLAWLYEYGVWPSMFLDHIDGDKLNNAISNLREVTHKENMNAYRRRPFGFTWRDCPSYHF